MANVALSQEINAIPNQVIVQLRTPGIDGFLQKHPNFLLVETLSKNMNIFLLQKKSGDFSTDEIHRISADENVKAVQFNHEVERRSLIPDDPFFAQQWNMLNTGQLNGKPGADINATAAWAINTSPLTKNGDTLVIVVADETFDIYHEDVNYFVNHSEIPDNGIDDDGNGFIDDYYGWNAIGNNGNVYGSGGTNHSTLISGIVGAKGNNTKGVAGVVWGVKVLPVRCSSTNEAIVIKGYDYVIEMRKLYNATNGAKGAFIVGANSSFGVNNGKPQNYPIWCALYDTMGKLGILNATATTNANVNVDNVGDIPTTCPSKWMISVTGTTSTDNRYGGFGLKNIDIAAPGASVISTAVSNNYTSSSGTSFACPHIAGAIAAVFAEACPKFIDDYFAYPDSLSLLVKDWILSSVTKTEVMNNRTVSDGRLNLHAAVLSARNYNCSNCNSLLSVASSDVLCKNEANGVVALSLVNSASFIAVWNDGDTSSIRNNLAKGLYQITVTDGANCSHRATVIIREPDTLVINNVAYLPPAGGNNGNIIVNAYGGGDSLWYSLDGTNWQLNNIFVVNTEPPFTVYVKNETGCIVSTQLVSTSVNEFSEKFQFKVYPNPAKDNLVIDLFATSSFETSVYLLDMRGRVVKVFHLKVQSGHQNFFLPVDEVESGLYFLKVERGKVVKLMVQR